MISYLKHSEIDKQKWDLCINSSLNGLANVYSWYLDIVSPGWEALIEDNYEKVMPLPVKRKFGIKYITQPIFIQQLGIFGGQLKNRMDISQFIKYIPKEIRYINIHLNTLNNCTDSMFKIHKRINQELNLSREYKDLTLAYSRGTKKSIRTSVREGIEISNNISLEEFIDLKKKDPFITIPKSIYVVLNQLVHELNTRNLLKIYGAYDKHQNLCTSILFFTGKSKIYLLLSATNQTGRESKAMFLIIDRIICDFAHHEMILDFAGSNLEGVHFFNSGFGAVEIDYQSILRNNLPWPLTILKS
jgi:hypothetical protein